MSIKIILEGGSPWGFRLQGGKEFDEPLIIAKINPNSKASNNGLQVGDFVEKINGDKVTSLCHTDALQLIRNANQRLVLDILRHRTSQQVSQHTDNLTNNNTKNFSHAQALYPSPAQQYSNAVVSRHQHTVTSLEEDQSGSTSDSQNSVINLSEAGDMASTHFSPATSPLPSTSVWSPSGRHQTKTYKPVSFSKYSSDQNYMPENNFHSPHVSFTENKNQPFTSQKTAPRMISTGNRNAASSVKAFDSREDTSSQLDAAPAMWSPHREDTFSGSVHRPNDTGVDTSASVMNAVWTPNITTTTALNLHDTKGSRTPILGQVLASPPPSKRPIGMAYRSTKFSPPSPSLQPKNKGLGLFLSQRDKHTEGESEVVSESFSVPSSPSPGARSLSNIITPPGAPQPVATPFAGLQIKSKPIKMVRLKDNSAKEETIKNMSDEVTKSLPSYTFNNNNLKPDWSPASEKPPVDGGVSSPLWTATGNQASPVKPYKSVRIDTSSPTRYIPQSEYTGSEVRWGQFSPPSKSPVTSPGSPHRSHTSFSPPTSHAPLSPSFSSEMPKLPPTQSATVTLLQKGRDILNNNFQVPENIQTIKVKEGQIPRGAVYLGTKESIEGTKKHTDTFYMMPGERKTEVRKIEKKAPPKYDGVGPTETDTDVPTAIKTQIEDKNQKDWYKKMYQSLHKTNTEKDNKFSSMSSSALQDSTELNNQGSTSLNRNNLSYQSLPTRRTKSSWIPAHAKYREEKYKNQPRSIEDYEPGKSSIAIKQTRLDDLDTSYESELYNPPVEKPGQFSKYYESDTEVDFRKKERSSSPSSLDLSHEAYKQIQKGGDIPFSGLRYPVHQKKERSFSQSSVPDPVRSPQAQSIRFVDRKQRDEDNARRKQQLFILTEEQKNKKYEEEKKINEARRHRDVYLNDGYWLQLAGVNNYDTPTDRVKSPIPLDRYEEFDPNAQQLQRPQKKVNTQVHGKARAMYSFTAQNRRELSFKKGDVIYLLNKIDRNWYEGEKHGLRGIFPINYVEILTSLEEAKVTAMEREGEAQVKYNFNAQTPVELSLKKGDVVTLIRRVDNNWYEGRCGYKQGIFPVNYVDVCNEPATPLITPLVTPLPSQANTPIPGSPGQLSPGSTTSAAPTIPTAPASPRDLDSFDFTTPYHLTSPYNTSNAPNYNATYDARTSHHPVQDSSDVYRTASLDRRAINTQPFPGANFSSMQRSKPSHHEYPIYKALYTYIPQNADELDLREGDNVLVMEKCDDGWFVGTSQRTKEFGTFPGNYVQLM